MAAMVLISASRVRSNTRGLISVLIGCQPAEASKTWRLNTHTIWLILSAGSLPLVAHPRHRDACCSWVRKVRRISDACEGEIVRGRCSKANVHGAFTL